MFIRLPENVIILTFQEMFKKIPGSIRKDSGNCSRRFRRKLEKILGNVRKDSQERSSRFREMLSILNESKPR